jgi:hypothetical protein
MESGLGGRGRRQNGEPEPPAVEDERFLDHHIEEILGTLGGAARRHESGLDGDMQSLN